MGGGLSLRLGLTRGRALPLGQARWPSAATRTVLILCRMRNCMIGKGPFGKYTHRKLLLWKMPLEKHLTSSVIGQLLCSPVVHVELCCGKFRIF